MLPPTARHLAQIALLAAAYLGVAIVGLTFAIPPGNATAVWPASGVALAAVVLLGNRVWPGVWLGALLANSTTTVSLAGAAAIATGNTLEALLAAWLYRRFLRSAGEPFQRVEEAFVFAAAAGAASTVGATVGGATLVLGGYAPWSQFPANWATWWLGDVAGLMIVAPLLLTCAKPRPGLWGDTRWAELAVLFATMVLASQAIFGGWLSERGRRASPLHSLDLPRLGLPAIRTPHRHAVHRAVFGLRDRGYGGRSGAVSRRGRPAVPVPSSDVHEPLCDDRAGVRGRRRRAPHLRTPAPALS